jgi:hypothetical protein
MAIRVSVNPPVYNIPVQSEELDARKRVERVPLFVFAVPILIDPEFSLLCLVDLVRDPISLESDLLGSKVLVY